MKDRNSGIILAYSNTIINMVCGLFLSSYLIRCLGSTEYGIYQTIASFANCLVLFEFGTGTVLVRNVSMALAKKEGKEKIEKEISTIWGVTIFLSVIILIVAIGLYLNFNTIYSRSFSEKQIIYGKKIFVFIVAYLLFSFYLQTIRSITLAYEYYSFKPKMALCTTVCRTFLITIFIWRYRFSIIIAIVDLLISLISCIYAWYFCKKNFEIKIRMKKFDYQILKNSLPLCIAIFLQTIVNQANNNVDKFIIGIFLTPEKVTVYSIALYIFNIFSSLTTIPISMYAPRISHLIAKNVGMQEISEDIIQPCRLIVLIGGTIVFGFIAVGEQFVNIVYGKIYREAWIIAILLMIPMFINMSNGVLVNVLDAINKRMVRSGILVITTIMNVVITVLVIERYEIMGAAMATVFSTFLGQVVIMNIYYKYVINIPVVDMLKKVFRGIIRYQIIGMLCALVVKALIANILLSFVLGGIVYVVAFGIGFFLKGSNEVEKNAIKNIVDKLKIRK